MRGAVGVLVVLFAACGGANDAKPDATCEMSAVITGSYTLAPGMLGAITTVKTWQTYDGEYRVRYLSISDGAQTLSFQSLVSAENATLTSNGAQLSGPGTFTRVGEPCAEGTFTVTFMNNQGMLDGSYRAPYLGENPPP